MPKRKEKMVDKETAEDKIARQRAERGYADSDLWDMSKYFIDTTRLMLKQLKKDGRGYPGFTADGTPMSARQWKKILDRMLFLLKEMDEKTCSLKNPYEDEWWLMHQEFEKKYPDRDVLKTEAEHEEEKKAKHYIGIGPERDPERGGHFVEVRDQKIEWDSFIGEYRNKCKNEFFKLFSDYFWDLWD